MKIKPLLSLMLSLPLMYGCASNSISEPNGQGAIAFGTRVINNFDTHPCARVEILMWEMVSGGEYSQSPVELSFYPKTNQDYVLFNDIKPGFYQIRSMKCHARTNETLNGKRFLEFPYSFTETIEPNLITLSTYSYYGENTELYRFTAELTYGLLALDREKIETNIQSQPNFTGWSFREHH
ncbi:hypothetical protein [Vibrio profundi]|uniref:hypothetical protein n=1 Tax=Vibrio profundi TaxID=1774960 RepID=UPI003734FC92